MVLGEMAEWEAYRWRLDEMFAASGVKPALAVEASSTMALIGLVKAGLGVTVYPARLAAILGPALRRPAHRRRALPDRDHPRVEAHQPHREHAQIRRHRPRRGARRCRPG